jgi:hypothetical protein
VPPKLILDFDTMTVEHKQNRPLLIIGCYPNTDVKKEILRKNLHTLKNTFDIVLTSHFPVDIELQSISKYVIYDSVNDIPHTTPVTLWNDYGNVYIEYAMPIIYNPGYSVYRQLKNALRLVKDIGYDSFFYMEGDVLIDIADIDKILELQYNVKKESKSAGFFTLTDATSFPHWWDCQLFYSDVDFFLHNTPVLLSSDEYDKYCEKIGTGEHSLESFLYHLLYFPHTDKIMKIDMTVDKYLSNSVINLTSVNDKDTPQKFKVQYYNHDKKTLISYKIYILKLQHTNSIFAVCQNGGLEYVPDIELYINNNLILSVKNNPWHLVYASVTDSSDTLDIQLLDSNKLIKQYTVSRDEILNNYDFIRLPTN